MSPLKIAKRCKICAQCDECGDKKYLSGEIFFHRLSGDKKFSLLPAECGEKKFKRYQKNAMKINFSLLPAECGEKKFFSATSRRR